MDFEAINRLRLKDAFGEMELFQRISKMDVKDRCAKVGVKLTSVIPVEAHAVFNPTVPSDNAMKKSISAKFLFRTGIRLVFDNMKELK